MNSLKLFPEDILLNILNFTTHETLATCNRVSKSFWVLSRKIQIKRDQLCPIFNSIFLNFLQIQFEKNGEVYSQKLKCLQEKKKQIEDLLEIEKKQNLLNKILETYQVIINHIIQKKGCINVEFQQLFKENPNECFYQLVGGKENYLKIPNFNLDSKKDFLDALSQVDLSDSYPIMKGKACFYNSMCHFLYFKQELVEEEYLSFIFIFKNFIHQKVQINKKQSTLTQNLKFDLQLLSKEFILEYEDFIHLKCQIEKTLISQYLNT